MRIVHVIQNLHIGGAERLVIDFSRALQERGHECVIVTVFAGGPLESVAKSAGLVVQSVNRTRSGDPFHFIRLVRLLKELNPEVVNTHTYSGKYWGRLAARLAGVPAVVHTEHGRVPDSKRGMERCADAFLNATTQAVVAVSADVRDTLLRAERIDPLRVHVIPNGIPTERLRAKFSRDQVRAEHGVTGQDFVAIMVGRLEEPKNHELAIRAAYDLVKSGRRLVLWLVGDGTRRTALETMVEQLGLQAVVRFLGPSIDVAHYLQAADLFILSSHTEGLPVALLEAAACGIPVVATRVGGVPEVIDDGLTGRLVAPGAQDELSSAISEMIDQPILRREMAQRAKQSVLNRYGLGKTIDAYVNLYNSLLTDGA